LRPRPNAGAGERRERQSGGERETASCESFGTSFALRPIDPSEPVGRSCTARHRDGVKSDAGPTGAVAVDRFWTAVLLAVFTCYVAYPFFPLTPPRVLFPDLGSGAPASTLRELNLWLLHRNGDQASLFPSGHVASVTATALAVRAALPRVGWIFLVAAASVAAATVVGRYHYAADAVAGMLVGIIAFVIAKRWQRA